MSTVKIIPGFLKGTVKIPPSKSLSHRAVICAGLSRGNSIVENIAFSEDIKATSEAMRALGVTIENISQENNNSETNKASKARERVALSITGIEKLKRLNNVIDCSESGSTLRFLIPIAILAEKSVTFKGRGKLVSRPLDDYYEIFNKQGIKYENINGELPLTVDGNLQPGMYEIKGNVSSQFITGLMFALPLLNGDSKIVITTELESKGYVDLTLDALRKFSVEIENNNYKEFNIKGNQQYKSGNYRVEGDFSQAAFWLTAGMLCGNIHCLDLNIDSLQGDKEVVDIINRMQGKLTIGKDSIKADISKTVSTVIDASQCPDIIPVLTVLAAVSEGTTEVINAERLRIKESDRLKAITTELNKLGADVEEKPAGLIIRGKAKLKGGTVDSWNDHRIAMALAVASIKCTEPVIITGSECVKKSYPDFWEDFKSLNGNIEVED